MRSFKPSYVASSNDFTEYKKEKRREQTKDALFRIGIIGSSAYAAKQLLDTDAGQSVANKLFKGHALRQLYHFDNGDWFNTKINKRINLGDVSLNAARLAEDLSPFKILRTFHTSSFLFPIASGKNARTLISADLINLDSQYYRNLIGKYGTGLHQTKIEQALSQGLILNAGKLQTHAGETLIENARLVHLSSDIANPTHDVNAGAFVNRIYEKFRNVTGIKSNLAFDRTLQADINKVGIIAGSSVKEMYGNWSRAYIRMAMEPAYKLVNKPMEFLTEYVDHIGHAVSPSWQSVSERFNFNIINERFTGSTREALWSIAKKGATRAAKAKVGFVLGDAMVRAIAPDSSFYSKGIVEGLSTFAVNAHVKFAEVWSDKFQELKQKQEDLAPGSTSLFTLAGFPLAGAMAGGTFGYLKRAGHITAKGSSIGALLAKYNTESLTVLNAKMNVAFRARPVTKWAFLGALAASIPAVPYIPGALVGKSSEELKAEYSGSKEVAVRTNRWWSSGSYEYAGTKIKYFRPHAYSSMIKNSSDLTIYGSQANEDRLNPILHPLDYLRNPYRLEQQNATKTPYPVWGMDVSFGGFFGKIFEKTAGQLIKPDKLNPKILATKDAYKEMVNKQLSYTTNYNGFAIDSKINNFKQASMKSEQDRNSLAALVKQREAESGKLAGILDKANVGGDAPQVEGLRSQYASMVNLSNYDISVDDADTVILRDKTGKEKRKIEIRLSGMDAPEVGGHENDPIDFLRFNQEQQYGKEATETLRKILSEQGNVSLAINKTEMSYGRYVGVLIGDENKNLNLEVIKRGGATILPWGNTDLIDTKSLKAAEKQAQSTAEGLWNLPRYQAVQLFNQMTGYKQTYNTLTRLDKLAMRPELASYVTYLDNLDSQKSELSQSQKEDLQQLAMHYNKASKDNRSMSNLLKSVGIAVNGDQMVANGGGFLKGALVTNATAVIGNGLDLHSTSEQSFTVRKNVKASEKELIDANMMYAPPSPTYSPHTEGIKFAYNAFSEFAGLKGWAASLVTDGLGFDYKDKPTELARSGESTNLARRIKDMNLGGLMGGTEALRRAIPQSGDTLYQRENPMQNDMPCLIAGTEVLMSSGILKNAEDLQIGDCLVSDSGQDVYVTNIDSMPSDREVAIDIYGNNLYQLKFSWNHPILTNTMEYINAEDIKPGDFVAYPRRQYSDDIGLIDLCKYAADVKYDDEFIYYGKGNNIKISRFWNDTDLFYLIGVYAAEGSERNKNKSFKLSGHINDKWELRIVDIFTKYSIRYSYEEKGNSRNYHSYCTPLLIVLKTLCPGNCYTKLIHADIISRINSKAAIQQLLKGIIDGDGYYCISADQRIKTGLHTTSKTLAYQIRNIIIDLYGYNPATTAEYRADKTIVAIHVMCSGAQAQSLAENLEYNLYDTYNRKVSHTNYCDNDYIYIKVRSVSIEYKDTVIYAQEVSGNHTFCVSVFATHNTWLPSKADDFYIDFKTGNPFTKIEEGAIRLPGAGYESRFKELQGLNPSDYPDIHKFKILSDVAMGSTQYYQMKDKMEQRYKDGILTDYELNLYQQIKEQTQERSIFKQFDPYKTDEDLKGYGEIDRLKSGFWQAVTHNSELPTESLTFFRPAGKFIHKRTATEDYASSQLLGNDMAMWTKPYAHMIKPTLNKLASIKNEDFMPEETKERRNIDEYFEALDYIKNRRLYKQHMEEGSVEEAGIYKNKYLSNPYGALTLNMDNDKEMTKTYIAFNNRDRQYYAAFSSERSAKEREKIINMLPSVQSEILSKIWHRRDTIENAQNNNKDVGEAIGDVIMDERQSNIQGNKQLYDEYQKSPEAKNSSFEEYLSDKKAEKIVQERTGMPSEDFVGWDPRIDINDIKLKTLMIGKEDVREFGFWQSDEDRVNRMFVLENNSKQIDNVDAIKRDMQNANQEKEILKNRLYKSGIRISSMTSTPSLNDDLDIFIE